MKLPSDFWEQLPHKTNAELYDMLAHEGDYLPEALAAAKEELTKRNLAPEAAVQLEAKVQSDAADAEAKAQERLSWPIRIFIFIFCAGLFGALLAVYYDNKGYRQKASDCWITLAVSMVSHIVLGIIAYSNR
jgi:hypothetical protein